MASGRAHFLWLATPFGVLKINKRKRVSLLNEWTKDDDSGIVATGEDTKASMMYC